MWTCVENFAEAVGASTNDQPMHSLYVYSPTCESKAVLKEALNMLFNLPVAEDGMKSLELWWLGPNVEFFPPTVERISMICQTVTNLTIDNYPHFATLSLSLIHISEPTRPY